MIDLVRKRHEGPSWIVFSELANSTGGNVKGFADAAAMGIWPSRGYELHGYEFKISREDLKRELRDPQKADNIGKFCSHWWLCLESEALMEGLAIPERWGILVPSTRGGGRVFKVVRKAPANAEAKAFTPGLVASMVRNITRTWVPKHEHEELKETGYQKAREAFERDRNDALNHHALEVKRYKAMVDEFERASGVAINGFNAGRIGDAVKLILEHEYSIGAKSMAHRTTMLTRAKETLDHLVTQTTNGIEALRELDAELAKIRGDS